VSSRWEKYNRRIAKDFEPLKRVMTMTIYGSYYPQSEKDFLISQRNFLRDKGYVNTNIVDDYLDPEPDITSLEKSTRCLEFSDVNFLVFTREGKRYGVSRELTHIATSSTMIDKIPFCTVFEQIRDERGSIPPLSLDDINNSGINRREFETEQQLQTALSQQSFAKLRRLQSTLIKRL